MKSSPDLSVGLTGPGDPATLRQWWRQPGRWWGLALAISAATVLVIASSLAPADQGLGTHRDLGLPACNWIVFMDVPCPTCGMTTSFSHSVRGQWASAFVAQPMGLVLCLVTAMVFLGGMVVAFTGAPLGRMVASAWNRWWTWGLIIALVLAWLWKIALHRGIL